MTAPAWAIRPRPDNKYRMPAFLDNDMAAVGWPALGDLAGCSRDDISRKMQQSYYKGQSARALAQGVGIVDKFVNHIKEGHALVVPDGNQVYFGIVRSTYEFHPELQRDNGGFPHWIRVDYKFEKKPILRSELPATFFDSLKAWQALFSPPPDKVWDVINNPNRYRPVNLRLDHQSQENYIKQLAAGAVPGINSPQFEKAVREVLSLYFPGLLRLSTRNAPRGADTDLKTALPGGVVVRVQVKCFQDRQGVLGKDAVIELRRSMERGEHGIIVTSGEVGQEAQDAARADPERPIGLVSGREFAQLVFAPDVQDRLRDEDLWALGLRRALVLR